MEHVQQTPAVSQRRACRVLRQPRATQRRPPRRSAEEERLVQEMVELASAYGRYGYRRITALLRQRGWRVNHKRVERLWRREGLKVPRKQPKRKRLWLNDGSCIRRRPERKNHVWSYDFVLTRTADGGAVRLLTILDEYARECLAIRVERKLTSEEVMETLAELLPLRGAPKYLRSDNGPEFAARTLRQWVARLQVKTLYIEPGSPWENGCIESFNGKLRDELLNRESFDTLREAQVLIEDWRVEYNTRRPHSSPGYRPPAPETFAPFSADCGAPPLRPLKTVPLLT